MNLIKKLITYPVFRRVPDSYLEVIEILNFLKKSKNEITIHRVNATRHVSRGFVSAFNSGYRVLVVYDAEAGVLARKLKRGSSIEIRLQIGTRRLSLKTRFIGYLDSFESGYMQLRVPLSISVSMPREYMRFDTRNMKSVKVFLQGDGSHSIPASLENISFNGAGIKISGQFTDLYESIKSGLQNLVDCVIHIENHNEIRCKLDIVNVVNSNDRHIDKHKKDNTFLIGGLWTDLETSSREVLNKLVTNLQTI